MATIDIADKTTLDAVYNAVIPDTANIVYPSDTVITTVISSEQSGSPNNPYVVAVKFNYEGAVKVKATIRTNNSNYKALVKIIKTNYDILPSEYNNMSNPFSEDYTTVRGESTAYNDVERIIAVKKNDIVLFMLTNEDFSYYCICNSLTICGQKMTRAIIESTI